MSELAEFGAIVLAAGKGTRMKSDLPKVLHPLLGRPMVTFVLDALAQLGIEKPVVIVGFHADQVKETLGNQYRYALQSEQKGSGHAVACSQSEAEGIAKNLLILCGDSPLFKLETMRSLMQTHLKTNAAITLTSANLDNPTGYGRILRNSSQEITGIVEEKDATENQKKVREVNGGLYAFNSEWLWKNIGKMKLNQKGEYCLTDLVGVAIEQGFCVSAVPAVEEELQGVNTPEHLQKAEQILKSRQ